MAGISASSGATGFSLPLAIKFFLGSAFLIALAVGAAVVVTYFKGEQIAQRAVESALTTSDAVQHEFEQSRLEQLQLKVQLIAVDPSTTKYVAQVSGATSSLPGLSENGDRDTQSITDLLKERQEQFKFDLGIILDAKGNVLGRSDQTEAFRESLADDAFVKPALAKASPFSDYWRHGDKLYQAAIMPLQQDQNLVGFLLLAQSVNDELCRKVAKVSGAQIAFWLPSEKKLLLAASSLDEAAAKALQEQLSSQPQAVLDAIMQGKSLPQLPLAFAGQSWVAKLTPTAGEGEGALGTVLALTSTDRIVASYRDILRWVLIGGLVSIVIALLLSYLLAKGILRPVRFMALAAEQAAAGNYRTQIALRGNDELARLSRAFDSLLSDLREKSDIEGYVGNLSRFLPEPAAEQARAIAVSRPVAVAKPEPIAPRRAAMVLLGFEFRQLAKIDPAELPEQSMARFAAVLAGIDAAAFPFAGQATVVSGARCLVAFAGAQGLQSALHTLAATLRWAQDNHQTLPACALVSGELVRGENTHAGRLQEIFLGAITVQLDRLLAEAATGQTLLARQTGDELKALLGEDKLVVATGATSGKRFYALSDHALQNLPDVARIDAPTPDAQTVVPVRTQEQRSTPRTPTRSTNPLTIGSDFGGRYRILSELGSGGMGVVYKAHDLELDDVVALKMLKPAALIDSEQLDRLKSEIKLARRITHPNVLRTFDFGEVDQLPYISMEYVRGLTLRYLLSETRRIPFSAGLRIARQLSAGLAAAHEVGVLHRDIKPENLILEQNGNAKLMDFGIARPTRRSAAGHTQPGMFLGTPNYSAPEQLAGDEVDERADIYSSGVLMCEMFCGKLPYSGSNTMEIYMAQMQQAPIKPSEHWAEIPPALEALILRCLARRPDERFASALELGQALAMLRA